MKRIRGAQNLTKKKNRWTVLTLSGASDKGESSYWQYGD